MSDSCEKARSLQARLDAFLTGDAWRAASMVAGWTAGDPLHYRLSLDKRSVKLHSSGMTPGTTTNDTTICTLAAGYRPPNTSAVVNCASDVVATQVLHLTIHTDGTVHVWGVGASTYVAVEAEFAIDV